MTPVFDVFLPKNRTASFYPPRPKVVKHLFLPLRSGDHWDNENRYEVRFSVGCNDRHLWKFLASSRLKRWRGTFFGYVCYEHILYQKIPILTSKYKKPFENSNPLLQANRRQLQPVFIRQGWGSGEWSELRYCPRVIEAQQKHLQLLGDAGELHSKSIKIQTVFGVQKGIPKFTPFYYIPGLFHTP